MDVFENRIEAQRKRLAAHGAIIFALGLVLGIPFASHLTPRNEQLSVGCAEQCIVGSVCDDACNSTAAAAVALAAEKRTVERLHVAHMQGLIHGILLIAMAAGLSFVYFSPDQLKYLAVSAVLGAWAAVLGAALSAAWDVDGRSFEGPWRNIVALCLFAVGVAGLSFAFIIAAMRAGWDSYRGYMTSAKWRNWARTAEARPRRVARPSTRTALEAAVKRARRDGLGIRVVGNAYSWSAGPATNGLMIEMRRLDRVLDLQKHGDGGFITVEAGITMKAMSEHAAREGLTLETTTVIPYVQVGGAFANGAHGTGVHHAHFTNLVTRLQVVTAEGELQTFDRPDFDHLPDSDADVMVWDALLCSLGLLGIIYSLTFECVPIFNVRELDERADMRATLDDVRDLVENNEYAEIFWFPYRESCWVKTWNRTARPLPRKWRVRDRSRHILQVFQNKFFGPSVLNMASLMPFCTPVLMKLFAFMVGKGDRVVPLPEALQYQTSFMKAVDMGYAIPIDPDYDNVRAAWFAVVDRLEALRDERIYPQNLVLHVRFVGKGRGLIAPSKGNDRTCYIEVLTFTNTPRFEEYFEDIEHDWIHLGGRPHWAKLIFDTKYVQDIAYGDDMKRFLEVRESMDPDGVFLNDFARKVLPL